jgi:hypothetical protein
MVVRVAREMRAATPRFEDRALSASRLIEVQSAVLAIQPQGPFGATAGDGPELARATSIVGQTAQKGAPLSSKPRAIALDYPGLCV